MVEHHAPTFEGRGLPSEADIFAVLRRDAVDRAWLLRVAVTDREWARRVSKVAESQLTSADVEGRAVAIFVLRALASRSAAPAVAAAVTRTPELYFGLSNPLRPEVTLAGAALEYLAEARSTADVPTRDALVMALFHDETRVTAFRALSGDSSLGEVLLPQVGPLLTLHPEQAAAVATAFALVHTPLCEACSAEVARLPEATRRLFGDAMFKHLDRVHQIKRWVGCRRLLFGA